MARVPVRPGDIVIGQPLKWDVYDLHGKMLLGRGVVLANTQEKEELLKRHRLRELDLRLDVPSADGDEAAESKREVRILLDETRIQPGDAMQIQSSLDNARYSVKLIGYQKGRSIVVTNPAQDGKSVYLKEGQAFVARIFSGRYVFAFPCSVLASAVKPYSYVHLSYPADVAGVNIRKGDRARLRAIAAFDTDDGARGAGVIVDLSGGGAFFLSKSHEVAMGRHLILKFKLPIGPVEYVLELPGHVRSVRANDDEPHLGTGYGIQFADVSAEDNLVLNTFIFQQMAHGQC
jgi:c-di-GMP-binding flagellar brake protein YcgR